MIVKGVFHQLFLNLSGHSKEISHRKILNPNMIFIYSPNMARFKETTELIFLSSHFLLNILNLVLIRNPSEILEIYLKFKESSQFFFFVNFLW